MLFFIRARLGILNQQSKLFKKLFQLDLFENETNQEAFSYFINNNLQRIIPKQIPLNALGSQTFLFKISNELFLW